MKFFQYIKYKSDIRLVNIFLVLYFSLYFNPLKFISIDKFSRAIGNATVYDYDSNKVISNFFLLFFVWIVGYFIIGIIINAIWCNLKDSISNDVYIDLTKKLNYLSIIAIILLFMEYIQKYNINDVVFDNRGGTRILFCIIISFFLIVILLHHDLICFQNIKWIWIVGFQLLLFFQIVFLNYYKINDMLFFWIIQVFIIKLMTSIHIYEQKEKRNIICFLQSATTPISFALLIVSIFLELCNILNQYEIIITQKKIISVCIYISIFCLCVFLYNKKIIFPWQSFINWGILLSLVFIYAQPSLQSIVHTEFFEQANIAVPISQMFLYGKIPIVETLSGHMLSDNLSGIVYGILNQDYIGMLFSPYTNFFCIVWIVIIYSILKECFEEDYMLMICSMLPISVFANNWSDLSLISILAILIIYRKQTYKSYALFWILLAISCIYKLDTGVAFGVASVISWIVVLLLRKQKIKWKQAVSMFFLIVLLCVSAFVGLCLYKGINPIKRIYELIQIMGNSNQNWAYSSIGQAGSGQYLVIYFIVPFICFILIGYYCYRMKYALERKVTVIYDVITLTFGMAYFVNFQRILIRHNYLERGFSLYLFFTAFIFLGLVMGAIFFEKKENVFVIIFCSSIGFLALSGNNLDSKSLLSGALDRYSNGNLIVENIPTEQVNRVEISENMKKSYLSIVEAINKICDIDETFLDMSNQSLLYSLSKKENPVYVSQSPGLLCGDFSQEEFIAQVKRKMDNIPIVLTTADFNMNCGISIDGVLNNFRYYKIFEFIYENYVPMCKVDSFIIWRHKNRTDIENGTIFDIRIENTENLYTHNTDVILQEENIVLKHSDGIDPLIVGLEKYFGNYKTDKISIILEYTSNMDGMLELFYTTEEGESFTGSKVSQYYISSGGKAIFTVPYTQFSQYRLDIVEGMELKIHSIKVQESDYVYVDYNYAESILLHTYNLGMIPYLWGMKDTKNASANTVIEQLSSNYDGFYELKLDEYDKTNGNYIAVEIDSLTDNMGTLQILDEDNKNRSLSTWNFSLKQGKSTYLFRVSADSYWYSGEDCIMNLLLPEGVEVLNASVLLGD